jgi:hypothetical protein
LRTCTCGSYEKYRKDHTAGCKVTVVTDSLPVIQAIREMRLNDAALDSLRKQLVAPDQTEDMTSFLADLDAVYDENTRLKSENNHLKIQLAKALRVPVEGEAFGFPVEASA